MGLLKRLHKKRLVAFLLLSGACYVLFYEYQQINKYQENNGVDFNTKLIESLVTMKPKSSKVQPETVKVYNETFLDEIRKMFVETKSYVKLDTEVTNVTRDLTLGVARKVGEIFNQKSMNRYLKALGDWREEQIIEDGPLLDPDVTTDGTYLELGIGQDEEDQLVTWLEMDKKWAGHVIEPDLQSYNMNAGQRSNAKFLLRCIKIGGKLWPKTTFSTNQNKDCIPLGAVLRALYPDISHPPDLLLINAFGYELDILQTFPFESLKVEVVIVGLRGALKDTTGIHLFMDKKGYRGRLISNNHSTGKTYIVLEKLI